MGKRTAAAEIEGIQSTVEELPCTKGKESQEKKKKLISLRIIEMIKLQSILLALL